MIAVFHNVPQLKKRLDWGFYTTPQEHALGRKIPQTRGKVLGGSSSVNGMLFVRGNAKNYDDWAAEGNQGWSFDDVLPSFKRLESWEGGGDDLRGADGPVKVTGRAKYAYDIHRPGMLHARILRSPHAHARIKSIDLSPARQNIPGVKAAMLIVSGPGAKVMYEKYVALEPLLRRRRRTIDSWRLW